MPPCSRGHDASAQDGFKDKNEVIYNVVELLNWALNFTMIYIQIQMVVQMKEKMICEFVLLIKGLQLPSVMIVTQN